MQAAAIGDGPIDAAFQAMAKAAEHVVAARADIFGVNVVAFSNDRTAARSGVFLMGLFPDAHIPKLREEARARYADVIERHVGNL